MIAPPTPERATPRPIQGTVTPVLAAASATVSHTGFTRPRTLVHVKVTLHLVVQVVTGSRGTTLLHVDLWRLMITHGNLEVVTATVAASAANCL